MDRKEIIEHIKSVGLSEKASKVYLSLLEMGEATVQKIAYYSGVKRTSIYHILDELKEAGAIVPTKRNKHTYYMPIEPLELLRNARERLSDFEFALPDIDNLKHKAYPKPRLYFLYGPQGFKHIWEMIFKTKEKEFWIITEGSNFLDFVREKYILDEIIKMKKKLGIKSKQLITDSPYARKIIKKDLAENRQSKIISAKYPLPFTEVITESFVAFISPRWDDTLFVVENQNFAKTRKSSFNLIWDALPQKKD